MRAGIRGRGPRRRGTILSGLVVVGVVALVVAIAVDATRARDSTRPDREERDAQGVERLVGPDTPQPGTLDGELIVVSGPSCRLRTLDLSTLRLGRNGPATDCRLWASPTGDRVVVATRDAEPPLLELALVERREREWQVERRLGRSASSVAWDREGERIAWCDRGGTVVAGIEDGGRLELPGCHPSFAADGAVVTRVLEPSSAATVLRDGERWFGAGEPAADAGESFGLVRAVGVAALPDDRVAVATVDLAAPGTDRLALVRDGAEETSIPLETSRTEIGPGPRGLRVQASPTGDEVAVRYPADLTYEGPDRLVALLDLRSRSPLPLPRATVRGLAWSPDGSWLAVSTGSDVLLYGPGRIDPTYVLPLPAADVAWVDG